MKLKRFFIFISFFIFLYSCGYTPIFSKKAANFTIESVEIFGDRNIGETLNNKFSSYKNKPDKEKNISLMIWNSKNKSIVSRNNKGEAQLYKISVNVKIKTILNEKDFFEKNIEKTTTFSATERKSDEKIIETKLIKNLSNLIGQEIILELLEKTK